MAGAWLSIDGHFLMMNLISCVFFHGQMSREWCPGKLPGQQGLMPHCYSSGTRESLANAVENPLTQLTFNITRLDIIAELLRDSVHQPGIPH